MSDEPGGPALRAVPGGPAVAAEAAVPEEMGLTPPERRAVSRSVAAVIAELGFASRERVDEAIANGKATGRTPEQVLLEEEIVSADQLARATAQRWRARKNSGSRRARSSKPGSARARPCARHCSRG